MLAPLGGWSGVEGRFGAWGAAATTPTEAEAAASRAASTAAQLQAYLPLVGSAVSSLTGGSDAYQQIAVLEAQIGNYQKMKQKVPFLAWFYDNEIAKAQAKLVAAKRRADLQAESESSTREWRGLGKAALVVGLILGGSIAFYFIAGAFKAPRKVIVQAGRGGSW